MNIRQPCSPIVPLRVTGLPASQWGQDLQALWLRLTAARSPLASSYGKFPTQSSQPRTLPLTDSSGSPCAEGRTGGAAQGVWGLQTPCQGAP